MGVMDRCATDVLAVGSASSPPGRRRAPRRRGWPGGFVRGGAIALALVLVGVPTLPEAAARTASPCRNPTIVVKHANGRTFGTNRADVIFGSSGRDIIDGRGGTDVICGRGGGDDIAGWTGNDRIYGGVGTDTVDGGEGQDRVFGGPGGDDLTGGYDSDTVDGGPDFGDLCDGGDGLDTVRSADTESGAHCKSIVNAENGL